MSSFLGSPDDGAYEDDESHSIPYTGKIDVETIFRSKGAYYGLVIPTPIAADERSQKRLLKKIQTYIEDFHSEKIRGRIGVISPENARIYVAIHPNSAPEIFTLLELCRPWVEDNNIMFSIGTDLAAFKSEKQER